MDIAVLIKQVPDTWSERTLKESDWTLDRESVDAVIDEIDTRGVETALQLIEKHGGAVTVVTMGPDSATDALRKALAMGADKALHITDEGLAGSDALQTSAALAAAIRPLGVDLVITFQAEREEPEHHARDHDVAGHRNRGHDASLPPVRRRSGPE